MERKVLFIRVEEDLLRGLRVLYEAHVRLNGVISFNSWVVGVLNDRVKDEMGYIVRK